MSAKSPHFQVLAYLGSVSMADEEQNTNNEKPMMLKCEICGKIYPKGSVCCGVAARNRTYMKGRDDEPQLGR